MQPDMQKWHPLLWALLFVLGLSSCNFPGYGRATPSPTGPTPTALPATATPIPLAASVNNTGIPLDFYEAEVARFEQAKNQSGIDLATIPDYRLNILEALIDLKLLVLGAAQADQQVSQADLDQRISEIISERGSPEAFDQWLTENGYSLEEFQAALTDEILAAKMVAMITEMVPASTEQVRARHILVATQEEAEGLLARINAGEDFGELAQLFSIDASTRPAGGDLGWFPMGYLLWPEIDQAAFDLEPGEVSSVVESELGYHLVETLERGEHQLDYQARLYLQELAVQDWLNNQRNTADIQFFIVP
jgi:parvulin-like peptidyl-prolyl isomerase